VLVYVIDPHPLAPDPSPYLGAPWTFRYSKFRQARTFGERLQDARNVSTEGVFDVVLADDLGGAAGASRAAGASGPAGATGSGTLSARTGAARGNNPVWCSWGPAPNSAWIVARNGTVLLAQTWFEKDELNATLRRI
jgi:hypothetical protein